MFVLKLEGIQKHRKKEKKKKQNPHRSIKTNTINKCRIILTLIIFSFIFFISVVLKQKTPEK